MTRGAGAAPTPFPVRLSSFVGRTAELRDVRVALAARRLVTLVGPGGAGKTRLAIEAARGWSVGHRWYLDLAPVDRAGVGAALAAATEAAEGPDEDPVRAAIRRIGTADGLLLVDNADLVLDPCARAVAALLTSCPGLVVLATSREPLRVEGEFVVRVPPLTLPSDTEPGDAVALFLDRGRLPPDASGRDGTLIREICRRLDGMPLAIELAAARVGTLSIGDIAAGLADRFRLLAHGPRTGDARQRSLAASIEWSHRLLTDREALALHRLAVFRGPFVAEAAAEVAAGGPIGAGDVVPLLATLVEKSFVVIDERDEMARYRLLETIRVFAGERLAADPAEEAATRDRHLRSLCRFAGRFGPVPWRDIGPEPAARLEAGLPDVAAAIGWAAATGDAEAALRLVWGLARFWRDRGRAIDEQIIGQALAIDGGSAEWRARGHLAANLAAVGRQAATAALHHAEQAVRWAEQAVRRADSTDSRELAALARCMLGVAYVLTHHPASRAQLHEARRLAAAAGSPGVLADVLTTLAIVEQPRSLPAARALAEQALAVAGRHRIRIEEWRALTLLLGVDFLQGRLGDLRSREPLILELAGSLGDLYRGSTSLMLIVGAVALGDPAGARTHLDARAAMARAHRNPALLHFEESCAALLELFEQPGPETRATLARAVRAWDAYPQGLVGVWLCDVATALSLAAGEPAEARASRPPRRSTPRPPAPTGAAVVPTSPLRGSRTTPASTVPRASWSTVSWSGRGSTRTR
ncbi:MAG TPA: hypothetical protein VK020_08515 [Microlunatus sp.]|nr:hypothetical protein [Microlunatus sp.]